MRFFVSIVLIFLTFLFALAIQPLSALDKITDHHLGLEVMEIAQPWIPSMTQTKIIIPIGPVDINTWYLAGTPYFAPGNYLESGVSADMGVLVLDNYRLNVGLGVAFMPFGGMSVPFILEARSEYFMLPWLTIQDDLSAMVFAGGILADNLNSAIFRSFLWGLRAGIGVGAAYGYSWRNNFPVLNLKLAVSLGYYL